MIDDLESVFTDTLEEHHVSHKKTDADDTDWALIYAEKLLENKTFIDMLSGTPDEQQLVKALLQLNSQYLEEKPDESWQSFFASHIIDLL